MALLTGRTQIFSGDTSVVDTVQQHVLGTRAMDPDGNEYVYMQGVSSLAAGDWVSFDEAYVTTRLITNAIGRVAIAMAAITATTSFGWFQIWGKNTIAKGNSGNVADNGTLYTTGSAGVVDDADASTELIIGAWSRSADSSGVFTAEISYPIVVNAAID